MASRYNQMTPTKTYMQEASPGMKQLQGSAIRGGDRPTAYPYRDSWGGIAAANARATTSNDGSFPISRDGTGSSSSPELSVSSTDGGHVKYGLGVTDLATPGAHAQYGPGVTDPATPSAHVFSYGSPENVRSTPRGQNLGVTQGSPAWPSPRVPYNVARGNQGLGDKYGSPIKIGNQLVRRDSTPRQGAGAAARSPGLLHPPYTTNNNKTGQSMYAVPEEGAVQEFAFRRGQQDRGRTRERVPANPFHPAFNLTWTTFYEKGKRSTVDAKMLADSSSPSAANYDWAPLINPYTQSPEHPHGIYDEKYSRAICEHALDGMEALIKAVCKRAKTWEKTVCDIPSPLAVALQNYPDLVERYDNLQQAAKEAVGGGLPYPK